VISEHKPGDTGLAMVLIERFEKWILPRVLVIKAKVDRGEKLADFDIDFLDNVLKDADEIKPHVDRVPEYQSLYTRVISLYGEITKKRWRTSRVRQGPAPPTKRPDKGLVDLMPSSRTQTVTR
jgi:hypothetical protein